MSAEFTTVEKIIVRELESASAIYELSSRTAFRPWGICCFP